MLRLVCFAVFVTLGQGQILDWLQGLRPVDHVHEYTVQYLDRDDIFLFFSREKCYIVPAADERWDDVLRNEQALHTFVDGVYAQIQSDTGVTSITQRDASDQYHSRAEQFECRNHDLYVLTYQVPSTA